MVVHISDNTVLAFYIDTVEVAIDLDNCSKAFAPSGPREFDDCAYCFKDVPLSFNPWLNLLISNTPLLFVDDAKIAGLYP